MGANLLCLSLAFLSEKFRLKSFKGHRQFFLFGLKSFNTLRIHFLKQYNESLTFIPIEKFWNPNKFNFAKTWMPLLETPCFECHCPLLFNSLLLQLLCYIKESNISLFPIRVIFCRIFLSEYPCKSSRSTQIVLKMSSKGQLISE